MAIRRVFRFAACAAKWLLPPAPGELPGIGGGRIPGSTMNGTWRFSFFFRPPYDWNEPPHHARSVACILFITTRFAGIGLCGEFTTDLRDDLHRASCAFGIQFSGRCFLAGRIGGRVCRTRNTRHGPARSRWRLRRTALPSGREENFASLAYRRWSHVLRGLALSVARRIARGLPESL